MIPDRILQHGTVTLAESLISECKVPANCCTKFEIIPVLKFITCWKKEHLTVIKLQWVGQKAALGFGGKRYQDIFIWFVDLLQPHKQTDYST